jgi:hypothetical protein
MSKILERASNPRVPPRGIVLRHAPDQLMELGPAAASACSRHRIRPFVGDELPVPAEQRVRRDNRRDLAQRLPTQPIGSGQFPAVVIGEP